MEDSGGGELRSLPGGPPPGSGLCPPAPPPRVGLWLPTGDTLFSGKCPPAAGPGALTLFIVAVLPGARHRPGALPAAPRSPVVAPELAGLPPPVQSNPSGPGREPAVWNHPGMSLTMS